MSTTYQIELPRESVEKLLIETPPGLKVLDILPVTSRLTKQDIVTKVAEVAGLSKKDASAALDAVISTIRGALADGNAVGLAGFGTFEVKTRAAREGRNPQSDQPLHIPAKKVPTFRPGKQLREAVD